MLKIHRLFFIFVALATLLGSCTPKNITYFQDLDAGKEVAISSDSADIRIHSGDKLSIIINSRKPELSQQFNLSYSSTSIGANTSNYSTSNRVSLYTVDDDGYIYLPVAGAIYVDGLTRSEVAKAVKDKLKEGEYFVGDDFVVTVEFDGLYFTVLGVVAKQGRYPINKDRMSIIEAVGMAGDMGIYGQRINVKVLRDEADGKKVYMVDFTKGEELLTSPVYYLKPNDVLYVEGNKVWKRQSTVNGNRVFSASFWLSLMSFMSSMYVIYIK